MGSPLRLSCGSLRRSVAGAAATLLWAFQVRQPSNLSPGSPRDPTVSLVCPGRSAAGATASSGSYVPNDRSSPGIPQGSAAQAPQAVVPTTAAHPG